MKLHQTTEQLRTAIIAGQRGEITVRQGEVLDFIRSFRAANKYSPTNREIGDHFGIQPNAVHGHLKALKAKRMVTYSRRARSITPTGEALGHSPIQSLLDSSATRKFLDGQQAEMTFTDACVFYGIGEGNPDADIARVQRLIDDVRLIEGIHEHLKDRFSKHLGLLRNRAKEMAS